MALLGQNMLARTNECPAHLIHLLHLRPPPVLRPLSMPLTPRSALPPRSRPRQSLLSSSEDKGNPYNDVRLLDYVLVRQLRLVVNIDTPCRSA